MKSKEINIRDPFVLEHDGKYFLYGTRSETAWTKASGFDCYVSDDLQSWQGPIEIFKNDGSFWADQRYWAPECWYYHDQFYLIATFKSDTQSMGVQILQADLPTGPFVPIGDGPITPSHWECNDGTLYIDRQNKPFLVFCQSFEQSHIGRFLAMPLSDDLLKPAGDPFELFSADEAPWTIAFPYGKQQFGIDDDVYLADGPFLYRTVDGTLGMLWSSFSHNGYAVGLSLSDNGEIYGEWKHLEKPLYDQDGGHAMIFRLPDGRKSLALHYPNEMHREHVVFLELVEMAGAFRISE
jgi:hypothetical protein